MKRNLTQADVVRLMRREQGERTAAQYATDLGISPQYLSDIYSGNRAPGQKVLEKMGLEQRVVYSTSEQTA